MSKQSTLTPQQLRFIAEYLRSRNATEAAEKAGYAKPNTSGYQLLKHPLVAPEIAKATKEVIEEGKHDLQQILLALDKDMELARNGKQYSALAKMQELKMKSLGHLSNDINVNMQQGYNLIMVGLAPAIAAVQSRRLEEETLQLEENEETDPFDKE